MPTIERAPTAELAPEIKNENGIPESEAIEMVSALAEGDVEGFGVLIDKFGVITDAQGFEFPPSDLKSRIELVKRGEGGRRNLQKITRAYGIRGVVFDFLDKNTDLRDKILAA